MLFRPKQLCHHHLSNRRCCRLHLFPRLTWSTAHFAVVFYLWLRATCTQGRGPTVRERKRDHVFLWKSGCKHFPRTERARYILSACHSKPVKYHPIARTRQFSRIPADGTRISLRVREAESGIMSVSTEYLQDSEQARNRCPKRNVHSVRRAVHSAAKQLLLGPPKMLKGAK